MANKKNELANIQAQLPSVWQSTNIVANENRKKSLANFNLKHGMMASIPIICKGPSCPYFQTCWIPEADLQIGERCPIEIAAIINRFDGYCDALNIDHAQDIVDAGLVKEVVDIEVMMLRADSLMASEGNFIQEVYADNDKKGAVYTTPELHKAVEFKERLRKEKTRILNQLNATRKDKKAEGLSGNDPSSVAARIIAKVHQMEKDGMLIDEDDLIIDADFDVEQDANQTEESDE